MEFPSDIFPGIQQLMQSMNELDKVMDAHNELMPHITEGMNVLRQLSGLKVEESSSSSSDQESLIESGKDDSLMTCPPFHPSILTDLKQEPGEADASQNLKFSAEEIKHRENTWIYNVASDLGRRASYLRLRINFQSELRNWTTRAKSFSINITSYHKECIGFYVATRWIEKRKCMSIEILQQEKTWEPLVKHVFWKESAEVKKKLVTFFRRSITQPRNKLKPILMSLISVHDEYCECVQLKP